MRAYDDALALLRSIRAIPEGDNAGIKFKPPSQKSPRKNKSPVKLISPKKVKKNITPLINNEDLQSIDEQESSVFRQNPSNKTLGEDKE